MPYYSGWLLVLPFLNSIVTKCLGIPRSEMWPFWGISCGKSGVKLLFLSFIEFIQWGKEQYANFLPDFESIRWLEAWVFRFFLLVEVNFFGDVRDGFTLGFA